MKALLYEAIFSCILQRKTVARQVVEKIAHITYMERI